MAGSTANRIIFQNETDGNPLLKKKPKTTAHSAGLAYLWGEKLKYFQSKHLKSEAYPHLPPRFYLLTYFNFLISLLIDGG